MKALLLIGDCARKRFSGATFWYNFLPSTCGQIFVKKTTDQHVCTYLGINGIKKT
jgi:hypothetical protein